MRGARGFTLIEITLVAGIFVAIALFSLPIAIESYQNYLLTAEVRTLVSVLRRAQSLSMANDHEASHGIFVLSDRFILFQGSLYASRAAAFDETYFRSPGMSVTGLTEVVFAPLSGKSNATGTVTVGNALRSEAITVNEEGTLVWQ